MARYSPNAFKHVSVNHLICNAGFEFEAATTRRLSRPEDAKAWFEQQTAKRCAVRLMAGMAEGRIHKEFGHC